MIYIYHIISCIMIRRQGHASCAEIIIKCQRGFHLSLSSKLFRIILYNICSTQGDCFVCRRHSMSIQGIWNCRRMFCKHSLYTRRVESPYIRWKRMQISSQRIFAEHSPQQNSSHRIFAEHSPQQFSSHRIFAEHSPQQISSHWIFAEHSPQQISIHRIFAEHSQQQISSHRIFAKHSTQQISSHRIFAEQSP